MVSDKRRSTQAPYTVKCVCGLLTGNPEETAARATASEKDGDIKRVSTKEWARSTGYDPVKLFNKVPVSPTNHTCRAPSEIQVQTL